MKLKALWILTVLNALSMTTLAHASARTLEFTFNETLSGYAIIDDQEEPCQGNFTITILDIDSWYADRDHGAQLDGSLKCLGKTAAFAGNFYLMKPLRGGGYSLEYDFHTFPGSEASFSFHGIKVVRNESGNRNPVTATSVVTGTLSDEDLGEKYPTTLRFNVASPMVTIPFIESFQVFASGNDASVSETEKAYAYEKFMAVFLGKTAREYLNPSKYLEN